MPVFTQIGKQLFTVTVLLTSVLSLFLLLIGQQFVIQQSILLWLIIQLLFVITVTSFIWLVHSTTIRLFLYQKIYQYRIGKGILFTLFAGSGLLSFLYTYSITTVYIFLFHIVVGVVIFSLHLYSTDVPRLPFERFLYTTWQQLIKECKENKWYWLATTLVVSIFIGWGQYNLGQFLTVDEPKWLFSRGPGVIEAILQADWAQTLNNDKPGYILSLITAPALFIYGKGVALLPEFFLNEANTVTFLYIWRLPVLLFNAVLFFIIAAILPRFFSRITSFLTTVFVVLSPVLLGISQVVNPDAAVWTPAFASFLLLLLAVKRGNRWYAVLSGIALAVALLIKYFAAFYFILFFAFPFILFFLENPVSPKSVSISHIRERLGCVWIAVTVSFVGTWILLPAAWLQPEHAVRAGIQSFFFYDLRWGFAIVIGALLFDIFGNSARVLLWIRAHIWKHLRAYAVLFVATLLLPFLLFFVQLFLPTPVIDTATYLVEGYVRNATSLTAIINNLAVSYTTFNLVLPPIVIGGIYATCLLFLLGAFKRNIPVLQSAILFVTLIAFHIYILGAALQGFFGSARYIILFFPLFGLVSAIGVAEYVRIVTKNSFKKQVIAVTVITVGCIGLIAAHAPYYMQYANILKYQYPVLITDNWGMGAYAAAEYMNSIQSQTGEEVAVWTDREGFSEFYAGKTYWRSTSNPFNAEHDIDYLVLSDGGRRIFQSSIIAAQGGEQGFYSYLALQTPLLEYYNTLEPDFKECINEHFTDSCIYVIKIREEDKQYYASFNPYGIR